MYYWYTFYLRAVYLRCCATYILNRKHPSSAMTLLECIDYTVQRCNMRYNLKIEVKIPFVAVVGLHTADGCVLLRLYDMG